MSIIQETSSSFEAIKKDLLTYVEQRPDSAKWLDVVETGVGTTIIELISGLGAFKKYHEMMRQRESLMSTALIDSSIYELAFNRGYLVAPLSTALLDITLTATQNLAIAQGDLVGTLSGDYFLYAMDDVALAANTTATIRCAVGVLTTTSITLAGNAPFNTYEFALTLPYPAAQLELLTIDNAPLNLLSNVPVQENTSTFALRRTVPGKVRMYSGNGKLGWSAATATIMTYRSLSYDQNLETTITSTYPALVINATLVASIVVQAPEYVNTSELKTLALYYPLDGRIVTDKDYEAHIKKAFPSSVLDVYSYNTDPVQQIEIIKNANQWQGNVTAAAITASVDTRRTLGMSGQYSFKDISDGAAITLSFLVASKDHSTALTEKIDAYLDSICLHFFRTSTQITTTSLAIELTNFTGTKIFPGGTSYSHTFSASEFIRAIDYTLEIF